jgi:hypothetical protein
VNPVESWAVIYTAAAALIGVFLGANAWLDRRQVRRRQRAWDEHTASGLAAAAERHPSSKCPYGCGMPVWDRAMHMQLRHAHRPVGVEDRPDWGADR